MNLENVRFEVNNLIPSSLLSDIVCFVFYDKHPRDEKNIDITVCTKNGELREYFLRDLQSSLNLNCAIKKPCDFKIVRNKNSELFYLLATKDELYIISSKEKMQIHRKLSNIDRYDINDTACNGEICLKVIKKDDAVPIMFDNNLECLEDHGVILYQNIEDSFPISNELKRKLVEARFSAKCNEKTYQQYLNLHQKVSLLSYQNQQPPTDSSVFQTNAKRVPGALKFKTQKVSAKVCNKNIVIIFNAIIQNHEPIENTHILLHNTTSVIQIPSLVYTTKTFIKVPKPPYFQEANINTLTPGQECAFTAVVNMQEFKQNMSSRIELSGSLCYELQKQKVLIPFEDIVISSMEIIGDEIDVLARKLSEENSLLAILATTEKTELCMRHIKEDDDPDVSISDLFCTYLQMDRVENASNVIVYKKSPYHALNGTMLVFSEKSGNTVPVSMHTRSPSQVLTFLHCIYNGVPAKIVVTTPSYKITSKIDDYSQYNEDISHATQEVNFTNYAKSLLDRSSQILEHLDKSMIKMNESKSPSIRGKVGTQIDLFACGVDAFKEFQQSMLKEAEKGVRFLMKSKFVDMESKVLDEQNVHSLSKSHAMELEEDTGSDVIYID